MMEFKWFMPQAAISLYARHYNVLVCAYMCKIGVRDREMTITTIEMHLVDNTPLAVRQHQRRLAGITILRWRRTGLTKSITRFQHCLSAINIDV